jgi:hypothetical protein
VAEPLPHNSPQQLCHQNIHARAKGGIALSFPHLHVSYSVEDPSVPVGALSPLYHEPSWKCPQQAPATSTPVLPSNRKSDTAPAPNIKLSSHVLGTTISAKIALLFQTGSFFCWSAPQLHDNVLELACSEGAIVCLNWLKKHQSLLISTIESANINNSLLAGAQRNG